MGTSELKNELRNYIETGDRQFLDALYKMARSYMEQKRLDQMVAEAEADIKEGRLHSQDDVQKMINRWTEE